MIAPSTSASRAADNLRAQLRRAGLVLPRTHTPWVRGVPDQAFSETHATSVSPILYSGEYERHQRQATLAASEHGRGGCCIGKGHPMPTPLTRMLADPGDPEAAYLASVLAAIGEPVSPIVLTLQVPDLDAAGERLLDAGHGYSSEPRTGPVERITVTAGETITVVVTPAEAEAPASVVDSAEMHPDTGGRWTIRTGCGSHLMLDLDAMTLTRHAGAGAVMPQDGVERALRWVLAWPKVGEKARFQFADGSALTCTEATTIEAFEEEA